MAAAMISTTEMVAGEDHYFDEPLLWGLLAAFIVLVFLLLGRRWLRQNSTSTLPESTEINDPAEVIVSPSTMSESIYMPPLRQPLQKPPTASTKVLQSTMPSMTETHFCPHTRDTSKMGIQVALHSAPSRPKPMTPPPSEARGASTSTLTPKTPNSLLSITPRSHNAAKHRTPMPQSEHRSEDAPEPSDAANMMVIVSFMIKLH